MSRLFDTHAHLSDARFEADREELIANLPDRDVILVMECATGPEDMDKVIRLADGHDMIYAAAGIHPHNAKDAKPGYLTILREKIKHPKVKAVGEIGLDYHYGFSQREVQKKVFAEQLELAVENDMPVVIHTREATKDTMDILKRFYGAVSGVMHCFSGSAQTAKECVDLGLYISFSGTLTFNNAAKVKKAAAAVPAGRIMAETDCPYLSPEPKRGQRNDPGNVRFVLQEMAAIFHKSFDEMCEINFENGCRLFHIDGEKA